MKDLKSFALSFIIKYNKYNKKDIIIIENVEEEGDSYKITYRVSASGNGYDKIYISGKMVFYDKMEYINIDFFNQYINELRKNKLHTLL